MAKIERTPFHRRLSVQVGVTVALVSSLVLGVTVRFVAKHQSTTLTHELTLRLLSECRSLSLAAAATLLQPDPELGLHRMITNALSETTDATNVVVLDAQRAVRGHRDMLQVGQPWEEPDRGRKLDIPVRPDESVWLSAAGEIGIETPVQYLDRTIGWLVMHAGRGGIEATVAAAQRRLLVLGGAGTVLVFFTVLMLVSVNLRPLADLRRGVHEISAGNLQTRVRVLSRNELGVFASLINSMAAGLEKAQEELIHKERLDHELEIARELQSMLLPKTVRPAPGYQFCAHYTPALEVSGDYYDILRLDGSDLAFVTADVSGKGVPALVVMAMFRSILRSVAAAGVSPIDVIVQTSGMLRGSMSRGMFATCLYGTLNTHTHRFTYASAGHCPPVLFNASGARFLEARGKPVGLFSEDLLQKSLVLRTVDLQPGDGLLLYTDGLVEALDPAAHRLGGKAVLEELRGAGRASVHEIIAALRRRVDAHRRGRAESDDLTMLVVQRLGVAASVAAGRAARVGIEVKR